METQNFNFVGNINGHRKKLVVITPVENGGVYTNKYCPQELLTGGLGFVVAVNGENLDDVVIRST